MLANLLVAVSCKPIVDSELYGLTEDEVGIAEPEQKRLE